MRALCIAFILAATAACGSRPLCGLDDDGVEIPPCDAGGGDLYCPNQHWSADGCNSCGCSRSSQTVCNTNVCE